MFAKILHANDGSAPAFKALELALALAKQNRSELHLVSVMEIDYMPEFVEDIRQETGASTAFCSARTPWRNEAR
jgi:nucleotide-binding universal stress UspA family protein